MSPQKHNTEESLRRSEERYHRMVDEVEDYAIILLDEEGYIENWNRGAEKIKGYTAAEAVGKSFRMFYRDAEREQGLPDRLLNEARTNGRVAHEGWRVKKDGSRFWGSVVITALHDDDGRIIGFSKVTRDLTERKLAEDRLRQYSAQLERANEELRRSEERYHRMVDEVEDYAIILLDEEGYIENWNRGAEKIKGYTAAEAVGKSFRMFYRDAEREQGLPDRLLNEARTNGRVTHEGWRVTKDGSRFWGSVVMTALHDDDGRIIGFSKVTRDLTERKRTEDRLREYAQQLEQKNRELEQFAYVASHDLQEPLRKIMVFGDRLLRNSERLDERSNEYVERMHSAARRMMALIEALLTFSRIDREDEPFEPTDLNAVVAEILGDLDLTISKKKAVIHVDPLPTIMALPMQMRQLFQNLISNALKFNDKDPPRIHLTASCIQGDSAAGTCERYRICVEDNGIGFEAKYADTVFAIFQRLHGRLEYEGTGIGLAICKKIVDVHHGTIAARSTPGSGTAFEIELPAGR